VKRDRVLVVERNPQLQRLLRAQLIAEAFEVQVAERGEDGILATAEFEPDLILLALSLPGLTGVETCCRLRKWTSTSIIALNDRGQGQDTVEVLDAGADDCVSAPFHIPELLARMRAVLRRARDWGGSDAPQAPLQYGNLVVDLASRRVSLEDRPLHLTPTEFELLRVLTSCAGRMVTHRELLTRVWGSAAAGEVQYLHVYLSQLRRKLEPRSDSPRHIFTEPGVGYRFSGTPTASFGTPTITREDT